MKKGALLEIIISIALSFFWFSQSNASKPSDFGLKEGDLISAIFSDDPDVYIINEQGFKRLFLNPEIFKFYTHLGGFFNVKLVTKEVIDSFPTSGLFRDCESNDQKVYGVDIEGEDTGQLHWVNTTGEQAVKDDPDFFKKVFCINKKEFDWYPKAVSFNSVIKVPKYDRVIKTTTVSTQEKLEAKAETKNIGKVIICHYPPENIQAYQTLTIDASALKAHLDHGDTIGACFSLTPTPTFSTTPTPTPTTLPTATPTITTSPSPTASQSFSPTPTPITTTTTTPAPTTTTGPTTTTSSTPTPTTGQSVSTLVTAVQTISNKITVNWSQTAKTFYIHRSVNGGAYQPLIGTVGTYFEDSNVSVGSTYRYRIHDCSDLFYTFCATTGRESNTITLTITSTPTPTPTPTPTFISANPSVQLISPNGGEQWVAETGRTYTIQWSAQNIFGGTGFTIDIYGFRPSDGVSWFSTNLTPPGDYYVPPTSNTYSWTIPSNLVSNMGTNGTYKLRVRYHINPMTTSSTYAAEDYSDSYFTFSYPTPTPTPTPSSVISAPTSVSAYVGTGKISVVWPSGTAPKYKVYKCIVDFGNCGDEIAYGYVFAAPTAYYDDYSITPGFTYKYKVTACDSNYSNCSGGTFSDSVTYPAPTPTPTASVSFDNFSRSFASNTKINRDLYVGTRGDDVKQLQALLINEVNYPANLITGYFGQITRDAVKRLQEKYSVKPALGYFGAITRKTLNTLISN